MSSPSTINVFYWEIAEEYHSYNIRKINGHVRTLLGLLHKAGVWRSGQKATFTYRAKWPTCCVLPQEMSSYWKGKGKKEKNNMLLEQRCSPDAAYWMVVQAGRFIPTLMLLCALGRYLGLGFDRAGLIIRRNRCAFLPRSLFYHPSLPHFFLLGC